MSTVAAPARHVRVTVEGTATELPGGMLRVNRDGYGVFCVNPDELGVTVEDITPPHDWRDGDVILFTDSCSGDHVWARKGGRWSRTGHAERLADDIATATILNTDGGRVLRYQAGGDQ